MITTVGDLLDYSRQQLNSELVGGTDSYALWKDAELITYINQAQQEFTSYTKSYAHTLTIPITSGVYDYEYDDEIIDIVYVYLMTSGLRVRVLEKEAFDKAVLLNSNTVDLPGGWVEEVGVPQYLIPNYMYGKFKLWPTPDTDESIFLDTYNVSPDVTDKADLLTVPEQYRSGLNFKVMSLALNKQDALETEDLQRSMLFGQKWKSYLDDARATIAQKLRGA